MLRGICLVTLVLLAPLMLSACQPLVVDENAMVESDARRVQGEIFLPGVPEWGGVVVSIDADVTEVDPETHEASGPITWHNVLPNAEPGSPTWKGVESEARYIFFGEDVEGGDKDAVVIITQIASKEGWGQGAPGEYGYFWLRDGGETDPDQWGMRYFSFDPFSEFYPEDGPPVDEGYYTLEEMQAEDPALPLDVELGDIRIIRPALASATE